MMMKMIAATPNETESSEQTKFLFRFSTARRKKGEKFCKILYNHKNK